MSLARWFNRRNKKRIEAAAKRQRKVLFEPLEPRLLLSADLSYAVPTGTAGDLTLRLQEVDDTDTLQIINNNDQSVLQSQALAETSGVKITGGDHQADWLTIDLNTINTPFSVPITFTDTSDSDGDALKVIGVGCTWNITGTDEGNVIYADSSPTIEFAGIERLIGAIMKDDTFIIAEGGSISNEIEGELGGFDTLEVIGEDKTWNITDINADNVTGNVQGVAAFSGIENLSGSLEGSDSLVFDFNNKQFDTVTFKSSPDSGSTNLDGAFISYLGIESVELLNASENIIFNAANTPDEIRLINNEDETMTIENTNVATTFKNPTTSLTINAGGGDDSVTIELLDPGFKALLTINGGEGTDTLDGTGNAKFSLIEKNIELLSLSYVDSLFGRNNNTFTGATIITHGYQPALFGIGSGDSLMPLAQAICDRADAVYGAQTDAWLLDYDVPGEGELGYFDVNDSVLPNPADTNLVGEVVLLFDWAVESNESSSGWGEAAGDALFSMLVDLGLADPDLGQNNNIPLHFIGHSFGAAVTSEAVERLAQYDVPVDHVTYLDPHDFDQDIPLGPGAEQQLWKLGKPQDPDRQSPYSYGASIWDNVDFADVYYQTTREIGAGEEIIPEGRPIPGAYNVWLSPQDLDNSTLFGGDHTDVWKQFYLGTVQNLNSDKGYALSRIANPSLLSSLRPNFYNFYNEDANGNEVLDSGEDINENDLLDNLQIHDHSFPLLVDVDTGLPYSDGLCQLGLSESEVTLGRWKPEWSPLTIVNGDFKNPGSAIIPGWSHHGGGGEGHVDKEFGMDNYYLELDTENASRTHNWLYVPPDADFLSFNFRRTEMKRGEKLEIRLDDVVLGSMDFDHNDTDYNKKQLNIPKELRSQVHTLTFEIVQGENEIESVVRIDNVKFETEVEERTAIPEGLNGMVAVFDDMHDLMELANDLPIIDTSIVDMHTFSKGIRESLCDPISDYFSNSTSEIPTINGVVEALIEQDRIYSATGQLSPDGTAITFDVGYRTIKTMADFPINLGMGAAEKYGLSLDASATVALDASLDFNLTFGLDLTGSSDEFFLGSADLDFNVDVHAELLDFGVKVGFLQAGVQNGTLHLDADITLTAADPNGDGRITSSELIPSIFQISTGGSIEATLPVFANFFGVTTGDLGLNPKLIITVNNLFTDPTFDYDVTDFKELLNFNNMNAGSFVSLLGQISSWLDKMRGSDTFSSIDIPFANANLGDILEFADMFSDELLFDDGDDRADGPTSLVTDMNNAFAAAGLDTSILAQGDGTKITLVAIDPSITEFTVAVVSEDKEEYLLELGFASGSNTSIGEYPFLTITPSTNVLTGDAMFELTITTADGDAPPTEVTIAAEVTRDNIRVGNDVPKLLTADNSPTFSTAQDLEHRLACILGLGNDSNVVSYDSVGDVLTFNIGQALQQYSLASVEVPIDFDLDLSPLLEIESDTTVALNASVGFDSGFTLGVYLGSVVPGASSNLSVDTSLSSLNDGNGVEIKTDPAVTASMDVPVIVGRLDNDVSFNITIDGFPKPVIISAKDTESNRYMLDIVKDVNDALVDAELGDKLKASSIGNRLILTAIDGSDFTVSAVDNLGFETSQTSNSEDLIVYVSNGLEYHVSLDSATTIGDVINEINTATNNTVTASVNEAGTGLTLKDNTFLPIQKDQNGNVTSNPNEALFQVKPINGSEAAMHLGILAFDSTIEDDLDGIIEGSQIAGIKLADRFFIENAKVTGTFDLSTPSEEDVNNDGKCNDGINASANLFGFVGVKLQGGGLLSGKISAGLKDPGTSEDRTDDGRITLTELIDGLGDIGSLVDPPTISKTEGQNTFGTLTLGVELDPEFLNIVLGDDPKLTVTLNEIGNPFGKTFENPICTSSNSFTLTGDWAKGIAPEASVIAVLGSVPPVETEVIKAIYENGKTVVTVKDDVLNATLSKVTIPVLPIIDVTTSGLGDLLKFQNIDFNFRAIVDGLRALSDFLGQFEAFGFLSQPLPLIDLSVNDLLNYAEQFGAFLDDFERNPAGTIQVLDGKLKEAFGLPADSEAIALSLVSDDGGTPNLDDDVNILRIDLGLGTSFDESLDIGFAVPGFDNNISGAAGLQASGSVDIDLDFGIDLADPTKLYLFDSTEIQGALSASGEDLTFRAALGPAGLYITGGEAKITSNLDDNKDDNKLFRVNLKDGVFTNHRVLLIDLADTDQNDALINSFNASDIYAEINSSLDATLPVYFPTESKFAGTIKFERNLGFDGTGGFSLTGDGLKAYNPDGEEIPTNEIYKLFKVDPNQFSLLDKLLFAVDGVDLFLLGLQEVLDGEVFGIKLPLIGDKLSEGADFIKDFREGFVADFRTEVENAADPDGNFISELLFDLVGPSGLDVLLKQNDAGEALRNPVTDQFLKATETSDILMWTNVDDAGVPIEDQDIYWKMKLGENLFDAGADIGFDLGVPGLGIETEGDINMTIDWDLDFGFGISYKDGFYLIIDDPEELRVDVSVDLSEDTELTGRLGFLQLTATDKDLGEDSDNDGKPDGDSTHLSAGFAINILNKKDKDKNDPSLDKRLGFSELGDLYIDPLICAEAAAELYMELGVNEDITSSASGFPKITSNFILDWKLDDDDPSNGDYVSLRDPEIDFGKCIQEGLQLLEFRNAELDIGSFVSDVIGPLVSKIKDVTEPVQPIIDVLTTPIPVISDLGPSVTLLDLAASYVDVDAGLIYAVADIITLINDISNLEGDSLKVPLLNFGTVFDKDLDLDWGVDFDLGSPDFDLGSFADKILSLEGNFSQLIEGISLDEFKKALGGDSASGILKDLMPDEEDDDKSPWSFPFFKDPGKQLFGMLMGKQPVLVAYDMPALKFDDFEWSKFFSIWGPLGVSINAEFAVTIDFAFGYDTLGIKQYMETGFRNPALVLNGLYVSDHPSNVEGASPGDDPPELVLEGGLWAAAELNLGIARGGVGGGIFAEVDFNLYDPDEDGRVRIGELISSFENEWKYGDKFLAPLAIFDVSGEMTAELFAFVKIKWVYDKKWNITPPITLLEYDIDFERPPVLASELGNGDLQLNMGRFAAQRVNGDTSDGNERFVVTQNGTDKVTVSAFGHSQEYKVTGTIIALAGEGNDVIDLSKVTSPGIEFEIEGGAGNDIIKTGAGNAVIRGGSGDDKIDGGSGNDVIYGDKGIDTIHGGGGSDLVFGDSGKISGESVTTVVNITDSDDLIYGDAGADILFGGGGIDTIEGGSEADIIIGDGGRIRFTGEFEQIRDDLVGSVSEVDDTEGDSKGFNDLLSGNTGADTIYGGLGNDTIDGGEDGDTLFGEAGFDTIHGGGGGDLIFGDGWIMTDDGLRPTSGGQADILYGGAGEDKIYGAGGNDKIHGDGGPDHIYGSTGADTIYGDGGNDFIYGEGEPDTLYGGPGDDTLDGGVGNDLVWGDDGLISTGSDSWNPVVYGANLPDNYLFGTTASNGPGGNDTLIGGIGSDFLDGQWGNDTYNIRLQGADTNKFINVYDSGNNTNQTDFMHIKGTMYDDNFLLRKSSSSSGLAFVALLNEAPNTERINYWSVEGGIGLERMLVSGLFGDDHFASDDVGTDTTLEGNEGKDSFQVGQLYNSPRDICASDYNSIAPEDVFATIETTVGWLSDGINKPMTVYGGTGSDTFTVFHNKAVLSLFGEDGDDTFLIKAFALAGSQEPFRDRTDVSGGAGVDLIQYAMNAPVNIDGGDGFDRVIIIGTEFGDDFVVTKDGVYGAGLNINFVNIESLSVDGAEGDDRFYVLSTGEDFITELYGGLGSDTFNMSGDTPPIISNDLRGHSGVITHEIENTGTNYDATIIAGISANIADNDTADPVVVVSEPDGSTVVTEGGSYDVYSIVLTMAPVGTLTVQVNAPVQTQDQKERKAKMFQLYSPDEVFGSATADRTTISLEFSATDWYIPKEVWVSAGDFTGIQNPDLDYDDDAIEGTQTGFINHVVTTGIGIEGSPDAVTVIQDPYDSTKFTTEFTDSSETFDEDLAGYLVRITDGPGAGQSLRILGVKEGDIHTLILDGQFRECEGSVVGTNSEYKISRDIEAYRAITVTVHDNDKAEVVVAATDNSTELFEAGSDDTIDIVLGRQPTADVTVDLTSNDGQLNFSDDSLTFTDSNWYFPQTVTVSADDDSIREGFHHGLISLSSSSGDVDVLSVASHQETIVLSEEQSYVGLLNRPAFDSSDPTDQTYLVSEVLVNDVIRDADSYEVQGNKIVFLSPNADYDEVIGTIKVTYQYQIVGFHELNIKPHLTDIADNEVPQVKITQTGGFTDVIEKSSPLLNGTPWDDTYEVVLTKQPIGGNVEILVDPQETKTSAGKVINWGEQVAVDSSAPNAVNHGDGTVTLTFTPANWDTPQEVFVSAVDDSTYDGDDTQVFAPEPHTISGIQGPLYLYGEGGNGSIIAFEPTMLHYETNYMEETDAVESVGVDGTTLTVPKDTLIDEGRRLCDVVNDSVVDGAPDDDILAAFVDEMLTVTLADGSYIDENTGESEVLKEIGQFRLIVDALDNGDDTVTLTLNEAWDLSKSWQDSTVDSYDQITEYTLTKMSPNFFADETEKIDYLFVYNEDSQADNEIASRAGWLTDSSILDENGVAKYIGNSIVENFVVNQDGKWLRGFGMAAEDLSLGGVYHPRGITYGDMEVVEINLGDGIDNFTVENTHIRADGYQTWTIINSGDEVEDDAGDLITIELDSDVAELHAGTATDSSTYTLTDNLASFEDNGNNTLVGYLVEITGGTGLGQQRIIASHDATTLTFDAEWSVFLDTTSEYRILGAELYTGTISSAESSDSDTLEDTTQSFSTANGGLAGYVVEIIDGAGIGTKREIISNTATELTVSSTWNSELDSTTAYRIYGDQDGPISVNAQGGDDEVDASASSIPLVIFGGDGVDTLTGGSADDIIFGDRGRVEYVNEDGKIVTLLGLAREKLDPQYITAFTANTLTDDDGPLSINEDFPVQTIDMQGLEGYMVSTPDGRGFGQRVRIIDNTVDILTITPEWELNEAETEINLKVLPDGYNPQTDFDSSDPQNNPTKYRISLVPEDQTDGVKRDPSLIIAIDPLVGDDDTIVGNAGNDRIFGGAEDDTISGDDGDDIIFGDHGRLDYTPAEVGGEEGPERGDFVPASLNTVRTTYDDIGGNDNITGDADNDIILGGFSESETDILSGNMGDDIIIGDNGVMAFVPNTDTPENPWDVWLDDVATLSHGIGNNDVISGNAGDDILIGGTDADNIYGDDAVATAAGNDGRDVLIGDNAHIDFRPGVLGDFNAYGSGVELIETTDVVNTTGGGDTIEGNAQADVILAGVNNGETDTVYGDRTAPTATSPGNDDDDVILGDNGMLNFAFDGDDDLTTLDLVRSLPYEDLLILGGNDTLSGNAGNDVVIGGTFNDTMYGDDDGGTAAGADGEDIMLGDNAAIFLSGHGAGRLYVLGSKVNYFVTTDFETASGGMDTISGNAAIDFIAGGVDSDTIYGDKAVAVPAYDGDDFILGDNAIFEFELASDDVSDLGRPDVVAHMGGSGQPLLLDANPTTLDRVMTIDPILGDDDTIHGDAGNDSIFGGTGRDQIWGDSNNDNQVDNATDHDGADLIFGDHGKVYPALPDDDPFFINNNFFSIDTQEINGADTEDSPDGVNDFEDIIFGSGNDDTIIGGQDDDILFGGEDNDILIGGHNVLGGHDEIDDMDQALQDAILSGVLADLDPSDINDVNDVMDGDGDEDVMAGDNAIIIRQNDLTTSFLLNSESPRYQQLDDTVIYSMDSQTLGVLYDVDIGFSTNIEGTPQLEPWNDVGYFVILLDHSAGIATDAAGSPIAPRVFGNDVMAGGAHNDEIFGQLGDDIMQGDGSIDMITDATGYQEPDSMAPFDPSPAVDPSFVIPDDQSVPTYFEVDGQKLLFNVFEDNNEEDDGYIDGDDYMEGNAGNDRMYGNLGQDDMIGGSSTLFGLDDVTAAFYEIPEGDFARPDGADMIYGGAGDPTRLARNDFVGSGTGETGPTDTDPHIPLENRHARDADVIQGDNANVYRLVGTMDYTDNDIDDATYGYLQFSFDQTSAYEERGDLRIVPRAIDFLDYGYTYTDLADPFSLSFDADAIGIGDLMYGESGDDIIHGMTGDDVLFGNSEDDDLYGEAGQDWISGGTGEDGILGDDGLIKTSRNDLVAEPLYSIDALNPEQTLIKKNDPVDTNALNAEISTPGNIQRAIINVEGTLKKTVDLLAFDAGLAGVGVNDIIYGGLNDDSIHAGAGDDAVSGAEALPDYYYGGTFGFAMINDLLQKQQEAPANTGDPVADDPFWFSFAPYNPGDILRYEGNTLSEEDDPHGKSNQEFALYDEFYPRRKIMLDANGEAVEHTDDSVYDFLLNFDETEGPLGYEFLGDDAAMMTDGDDKIFGDLGHDWIVGGTGRDNMYGGRGDDLLNMDDNHDSGPGGKVGPHDPPPDPLDNTASDEYQAYADIAYGGAGRDVLILNTGADRAIDWVGEYNSYIVPFAPFGAFHISRTLQPQLPEFLYALSESDGIDTTVPDGARYVEQKGLDVRIDPPDPFRQGEPYGELGMVRQMDYDWFNQTGAPNDPQPGNLQGKREIMRRELFQDTVAPKGAFAETEGIWTVNDGKLEAAPVMLGEDAVSIYHLDQMQPTYMEALVTINADKDKAGFKSNVYIIYDYQSPTDFKFAGVDVGIDKIQIGHYTVDGWILDTQTPMQLKANTDYDLTLVMYGTLATLWVDETVSLNFDFSDPLYDFGLIGLATNNAVARFDDWQVQKLPPTLTFQFTEDFAEASTNPFEEQMGNWMITDGHYSGSVVEGEGGDRAITTWAIEVATWSLLEFEAYIDTETTGGLIFDYYDADNFKFTAIDAIADQIVIGHHTSKGWFIDASADASIETGTSYNLGISMLGTSVSVTLNDQAVVGHVFNSLLTDGFIGFLSKDGATLFDDVVAQGDDPAYAENLTAAVAPDVFIEPDSLLTCDDLAPIVDEAIERWTDALGIDDALAASLHEVSFRIVDFSDLTLGRAFEDTILIDADAAGYGWFVDTTPYDDVEFSRLNEEGELVADSASDAYGDMDLLTVVMHELGHVLGLEDLDPDTHDLMSETLDAGVRQLADDQINADSVEVNEAEDLASLVVMDTTINEAEAIAPAPAKYGSSWLTDFLTNGAGKRYNKFDPKDDIKIEVFDDDEKLNKEV